MRFRIIPFLLQNFHFMGTNVGGRISGLGIHCVAIKEKAGSRFLHMYGVPSSFSGSSLGVFTGGLGVARYSSQLFTLTLWMLKAGKVANSK